MSGKVIGIVVAAIVVVGGGWYIMNNKGMTAPADSMGTSTGTQQAGAPVSQQTGSGTIGALLAMGSVKCDISTTSGGTSSQGTVYVASGKMRGDFTSTVQGKAMHASMINDGTYIYSWTDMVPQGVKIPVSAGSSAAASHGGVDSSTAVTYSCAPWSVDATMFAPPSSISFMAVGGAK